MTLRLAFKPLVPLNSLAKKYTNNQFKRLLTMASDKYIVLITGANSGIGLEVASQLLDDPSKHVLLGSRSAEKGEAAVKDLQSRSKPGTVELIQIDVDSEDSINAAAETVKSKFGRLDALVNNAAAGNREGSVADKYRASFKTNVLGAVLTSDAFIPLLKESTSTPRIVNVSSGAGSITILLESAKGPPRHSFNMGRVDHYQVSKAAMNMMNATQAVQLGPLGFKVFTYNPGFTVSNLGPFNKAEHGAKPTSEGAAPIVKLLNGERDDEHGCFVHADGQHPW